MQFKVVDDAALGRSRNEFNLVRILLASLVVYSHGFFFVFGGEGDGFSNILGEPISSYAVDGFFIISGFLVYRSIVTNNSIRFFALARLTRLWPALVTMLILLTIGGLAYTALSPARYFAGHDTLKFLFVNPTFVFSAFSLSGVTCGKELCNVNGSLWTLPWEARCYFLLAILGVLRLTKPQPMTWLILPATLVFAIAWDVASVHGVPARIGGGLSYQFERLDRLWVNFAIGIACYLFRRRLPLSWWVCIPLLTINIAVQLYYPPAGLHVRQLFIAYFVMCLGFVGFGKRNVSASWPDYSYGMYIYAFPVMFVLQHAIGFRSPYALALADLLCTIPFAAASWHFVEKPALDRLKAYRKRMAQAPSDPAPMASEVLAPGSA